MTLPFQRHQKLRQQLHQQGNPLQFSHSLDILKYKPFWIWDRQEHLKLALDSNQRCCFNHIVGCPTKEGREYPLFDYEKIMYDTLMNSSSSVVDSASARRTSATSTDFKDKHLWIKKATGLGISEFMLRLMAWLATRNNDYRNSQMCIITGPNIDIAIKLIKRLKAIFENKLGIPFQDKETVIELNGCTIEAFPSNHLDSYRALENPKFILLDEADFWRKSSKSRNRQFGSQSSSNFQYRSIISQITQDISNYNSHINQLDADKNTNGSLLSLKNSAQAENTELLQTIANLSSISKCIGIYELDTILLIIGTGLGGMSEIARNKLLGYPAYFIGGIGIIVLILITFVPSALIGPHAKIH